MPGEHFSISSRTYSQRTIIAGSTPELRLTETDQTAPAGMYRLIVSGDVLTLERARVSPWDPDIQVDENNPLFTFTPGTLSSNWGTLSFNGPVYGSGISMGLNYLRAADNVLVQLGTDADQVALSRAATLAADTAITSALLGTTAGSRQALAANSWVNSNITASGDYGVYVNVAGVSKEAVFVDASAQVITLGFGLTGGINLGGANQTIPGIAVDTVNLTAVDVAAGDRRLAIQTEHAYGGPIIMGAGTIWVRRFLDGATGATWLELGRAGGSYASPTALGAGVNIGEVSFTVYNGVVNKDISWPVAAEIRAVSLELASGTISSGKLVFLTTLTGAYNSQVAKVEVADEGMAVYDGFGLVIGALTQVTVGTVKAELEVLGSDASGADGTLLIGRWGENTSSPKLHFLKSRNATVGSNTIVVSGDYLGALYFYGADGGDFNTIGAAIEVIASGTIAANRVPSGFIFYTAAGAADDDASEKWRISHVGELTSLAAVPTNVAVAGAIIAGGGIAFTDVLNAWIDDATHGTGTTTLYIGNNTINVTAPSDRRLKRDEQLYTGSVLDGIRQLPFKTYYFQDEQERTFGLIAQDVQQVWPEYVVERSDQYLQISYPQMMPMVLRGLQETDDEITKLKARVAELEARLAA